MSAVRTVVATAMTVVAVALLGAAPAAAQTPAGVWGCTSNPLSVSLAGLPDILGTLARANIPENPCLDDSSTLSDIGGVLGPALGVTALTATTTQGGNPNSPHTQEPNAFTEVAGVRVEAISEILTVGAAQSSVSGSCVGTTPTFTNSGFVTDVRIAGTLVPIDPTVLDQVVDVSSLLPGNVATLRINEVVNTATSQTRNAVRLTVLTALTGQPVANVVVGEAKASYTGTPCVDLSPVVTIVDSGINRVLKANIAAGGDHTISSCEFRVRTAGSTGAYTTIPGTVTAPVAPGSPYTCTATMPRATYPVGTYEVQASATDNAGLSGADNDGPSIVIVAPTVATPTATGRDISAVVTPAPGVAIALCSMTIKPTGSSASPTTIAGTVNAGPPVTCSFTVPAEMRGGDYDVVVTATDLNGDAGSSSTTTVTVGGIPGEHTITNVPTGVNRALEASVTNTAPATIESCSFTIDTAPTPTVITGTYTPAAGTPSTSGTCTATVPSSVTPGSYNVTAAAVDDEGDVATDTDPLVVDAPEVATPTAAGRIVSAVVTPADGPIDIDTCTITITAVGPPAGTPNVVPGTYTPDPDPATGICAATIPDNVPGGSYDATVDVVDANGDTGSASTTTPLTIDPSPSAPTVDIVDSGVNRQVLANVGPTADGAPATSCDVAIGAAGGPYTSIGGTLGGTAPNQTCRASVPGSYAPGSYEVKVTATDTDGDSASDVASYTVGAPSITPTTVTDRDLSATITPATGVAIDTCQFTVTPSGGGTAVVLPGTVNVGPPVTCTATAPSTTIPDGIYTIVADVVDDNGDTGTSTTTGAKIPNTPSPPTVTIVDTPNNREIVANITPVAGETITACTISARPTGSTGDFVAVTSTYSAATGQCVANLPAAQYPPGSYEVKVTATDSSGDVATATGTEIVAAPQIGPPTLVGETITVPITPAPGTTIAACTITITPLGGKSVTVTGTYDATAKVCRALIPAGVPAGPATITTTATDDDGTRAVANGSLVLPPRTAGEQLTACPGSARLVLTQVRLTSSRVQLAGAAVPELIGKQVTIKFVPTGEVVASATVGADGLFRTSAPPPSRARQRSNSSRYQAFGGAFRSRALKLTRRATTVSVTQSGASRVVFIGKVAKPLNRSEIVRVQQLVRCGIYRTVATTKMRLDGSFRISFARPAGQIAAIYRAQLRVPSRPGGRAINRTFTTPSPITFE
jgi:hypothetical protein